MPFEQWAPGSQAVLGQALFPALAMFTWSWQVHPSSRTQVMWESRSVVIEDSPASGFWKEAWSLAFNRVVSGAPVKRKKTDLRALCGLCHWVDGLLWLETVVNVILILQKPLIGEFRSLAGFSLQSYFKARWCKAGKESLDNSECRKCGPNLTWWCWHISREVLSPVFSILMQAVYKNLPRKNRYSSFSEDSFLRKHGYDI